MTSPIALALALLAGAPGAFDHTHAAWTRILQSATVERPGPTTQVDYAALRRNPEGLRSYLAALSRVDAREFAGWSPPQRLAFLVNAYNAHTVDLVVRNLPLASIKDVGGLFSSPWKRRFIPLLGETLSLDGIEHDRIRRNFHEPRIHFALVCASRGCPRLQRTAFVADSIHIQLERGAREFLADRGRNRVSGSGKARVLEISRIFEWYGSDFGNDAELRSFLESRMELAPADRAALKSGALPIRHLPYDWSLNDVR